MIARIGLTGGIGSGKSTVARQLADMGALAVDTDAISRSLTAPGGTALPAIAAAFGPDMVGADGALDRARMRAAVFSNPAARQTLEGILHPLIGAQADALAQHAQPGQVVVFDVPLLTESGRWKERVDRVLVVDCEETTQVQRVMARSGWSAEEVWRVIRQQASRPARRAIADAVILNEGLSLGELQQAVCQIWQQWGLPSAGTSRAG